MPFFSRLRYFDWPMFLSVVCLAGIGLAVLYSTSLTSGGAMQDADFGNFWKQAVFVVIGLGLSLMVASMNYRGLAPMARACYVGSIVLLLAVLIFGKTIKGTTGWFGIGGFGVQPVELVKILLIIFLAKFLAERARSMRGAGVFMATGAAVGVIAVLVLLQPDFGSTLLLVSVWFAMLLISGIKRSHLVIMTLAFAAVAALAWAFALKPYQRDRIAVFLDPGRDPFGRGYQVTQSIIAVGSGGVTGKGLGFGSQSQLRFLPERQTDFLFAALAEELGFVGVLLVLGLFAFFFYRGYALAAAARDDFSLFLVVGILVSFAIEIAVNVGGTLGLLPITGIALPFLSYGGSSLLSKFLMVGLLESVAARR
ncbi:rod shape-determining protein RodA [Candidatus Uhrbacteria bacterium]|nr:rod shape-determining protein RodA [Candidatus Uhrbacteria bacterium]